MAYAILRTRKLKTARDMTVASMHNGRSIDPPNADEDRADENKHSHESSPIMERFDQAIEGAGIEKVRSNAVRGIEVLMAFSPEARDSISPERWNQKSKEWLGETFGSHNILQFDLHMDESTPHAHAIVVPINGAGKLVAKDWLGGREKLSQLQDSFAEKMAPLGLERGKVGSKRKHTPIAEYHNTLAAVEFQPTPEIPRPPITGRDEWQKEQQRRMDELAKGAQIAAAKAAEAQKRAEAEKEVAAKTAKKNKELHAQIEKQKAEVLRLKQSLTPTNILKFNGYDQPDKIEGKEHVYRTEQGKVSVNIESGLWSVDWQKGGGSVVDLEIALGGGGFKQAVQRLKGAYGDDLAERAIGNAERVRAQRAARAVPKGNGIAEHLPKFRESPGKWQQVRDYLVNRLIPEAVIDKLHAAGKLWANNWGSACFGTTDPDQDGAATAVHIRGTQTAFKQTIGTKSAPFVVNGSQGAQTALVESPIDAMALNAMTGLRAITYGGTAFEDAREHTDLIAFDADDHGRQAARKLQAEIQQTDGYRPRILRPPHGCKDWAETLEQGRGTEINLDGPDRSRGIEI
jgi:hypothetical protein